MSDAPFPSPSGSGVRVMSVSHGTAITPQMRAEMIREAEERAAAEAKNKRKEVKREGSRRSFFRRLTSDKGSISLGEDGRPFIWKGTALENGEWECQKEGYLYKSKQLGAAKGGGTSKKLRFFKLFVEKVSKAAVVEYYEGRTMKGAARLNNQCQAIPRMDGKFEIHTPGRVFYLEAEAGNSSEAGNWVMEFQMAINFTSGSENAFEIRKEVSKHVEDQLEWKRQITAVNEEQNDDTKSSSSTSYADIDVNKLLEFPSTESKTEVETSQVTRPETPEELYSDPKQWTVGQVCLWLKMMNLGKHADAFAEALLDGHYLYSEGFTKGDLEELGVTSTLEQKRILQGQASIKNICDQLYPDEYGFSSGLPDQSDS